MFYARSARCANSYQGAVDHYRIHSQEGKLTIDEEEFFDDLDGMISHYKKVRGGLHLTWAHG
jgi:hypothetical protein